MVFSGIGYDVHALTEGRPLVLGGVEIPHSKGLLGHSDADVLIHAIADALLGTIGAGDIGHHFPNTDESIRGIRSTEILSRVVEILAGRDARIINVDATVIAEAPKIAPHIPAMKLCLAEAMRLPVVAGQHQGNDQRGSRVPGPGGRNRGDGGRERVDGGRGNRPGNRAAAASRRVVTDF